MYRITRSIGARLDALAGPQGVAGVAPILAFQSVADGTVSTEAVVEALFRRLAPGGHALVLFDLNRFTAALSLMLPSPVNRASSSSRGRRCRSTSRC